MNKAAGFAFLAAGIALIGFGISASESLGSELSRLFSGTPSDKSIWLLAGGIAATALGTFVVLQKT
jgi:hypothetical protein